MRVSKNKTNTNKRKVIPMRNHPHREDSIEIYFPTTQQISKCERDDVRSVVKYLKACSPSGSYLVLDLQKRGGKICGNIKVMSFEGVFYRSYDGESLYETLYHLRRQIELDLERWKFTRKLPQPRFDTAI